MMNILVKIQWYFRQRLKLGHGGFSDFSDVFVF